MAKGMRQSTILNNYGGEFVMPGGFKVKVAVLDKEDANDHMGGKALALYYQDEHLICLKRSRPAKLRRTDLEHELQHMVVDWIDHFIRKARVKKKR